MLTEDYPFPDTGRYVLERYELPIITIWKKNNDSQALRVIEREIDKLRPKPATTTALTPQLSQRSVPVEVAMSDNNTVVTATSSTSKVAEKNERVLSFYSVLFASAQYDRHGKVTALLPAEISDDALELFSSSSSVAE